MTAARRKAPRPAGAKRGREETAPDLPAGQTLDTWAGELARDVEQLEVAIVRASRRVSPAEKEVLEQLERMAVHVASLRHAVSVMRAAAEEERAEIDLSTLVIRPGAVA